MPVEPEAHRGGKFLTAAKKLGTWSRSLERRMVGRGQ